MLYTSKTKIVSLVIYLFSLVNFSCVSESPHQASEHIIVQQVNDAPDMINHLSDTIQYDQLSKHLRIQDFFFTSCPSICPKMSASMLKIQSEIVAQKLDVKLFSISIDPKRDSLPVLARYARKLGAKDTIWQFLRGSKDAVYQWGNQFQAAIKEDRYAPGGFMHSGALSLVDKNGVILGIYDGTIDEEVEELINRIKK